ncbi:MAG: D-glycero-beta-D-manno-heptose-7-phosphate kinase [Pedobacter sp.]|nr:MAG: D-glycero-beta-D-manno-heptose-7-phosphate kinase [Pedobacter sp.]
MQKLFDKFNTLNILIVGDVMIDTYIWGHVDRISPEAPVPVVSTIKKESRLGGAANVALNVQSLGANPLICSVIGDDIEGNQFQQLLNAQNLSNQGIVQVKGRPTTVKTRVIGHHQQIVRIDSETDQAISPETTTLVFDRIKRIIENQTIHAIIFEDYDKGLITEELIKLTVGLAKKKHIITVVDPKKRNFLHYKGVTLFKPNLKELREGLKIDINPQQNHELEDAIDVLQKQLNAKMIMVTLSELGAYMSSKKGKKIVPAHVRDIADVSGAGDTVVASATLCLAAGLDEFSTVLIANLAGGLVCEYVGVVPIKRDQLLAEVKNLF